jgi:hypothetical protein
MTSNISDALCASASAAGFRKEEGGEGEVMATPPERDRREMASRGFGVGEDSRGAPGRANQKTTKVWSGGRHQRPVRAVIAVRH